MPFDLFGFVDLYDRALASAQHLLDKGEAHATATGVDARAMLDWRLIDDMQPLAFQLGVLCSFTRQWPARVAGIEVPPSIGADLDLAGYRAALARARADLAALTPAQFTDREDVPLAVTLGTGITPMLPAGRWLSGFATTNIYFHLSTAYAILRAHGVPIGKADLFASGL